MISGRRNIHCDVASALSFCGKVKLASAEVLLGWNWMAAVGDDESVNLYISRCSKLFYSIHAGENLSDIVLPYYFVPTTAFHQSRSPLRSFFKTAVGTK